MYIIPAIDILDKKVVRLNGGDYQKVTNYDVTLEEMIHNFQSNGTNYIQIIDLNGAKGDFSNQYFIADVIKKTEMKIQYGGGVRSIEKVKELIGMGVHRIIVGTQAITNPDFLPTLSEEVCDKEKCSDQVIVAIDVLDEVIKYAGWLESSPIKLMDYVDRCLSLGFFRFLCTDIGKDGKLQGTAKALYKKLLDHSPFIKLIGGGGVNTIEDIKQLEGVELESFVVGRAIYEGKITIEEIQNWNLNALISF